MRAASSPHCPSAFHPTGDILAKVPDIARANRTSRLGATKITGHVARQDPWSPRHGRTLPRRDHRVVGGTGKLLRSNDGRFWYEAGVPARPLSRWRSGVEYGEELAHFVETDLGVAPRHHLALRCPCSGRVGPWTWLQSSDFFSASTELMSGLGAPARAATPTPDFANVAEPPATRPGCRDFVPGRCLELRKAARDTGEPNPDPHPGVTGSRQALLRMLLLRPLLLYPLRRRHPGA